MDLAATSDVAVGAGGDAVGVTSKDAVRGGV
jgi:hypothetical protein